MLLLQTLKHQTPIVQIISKLSFLLIFCVFLINCQQQQPPIKVGILHSLTGTMSISEKSVVDATLMAISEVNEKGGILGRKIEAIVVDGKSDWPTFAKETENLITKDKVSVIFGGWTSASRKMMKPIIEKHNHLLFYPIQYEGLESSPNIIYTGAAPNQQITPAIKWSVDHLGKRIFIVGSDYVFPRSASKLIKFQVAALGAKIVGEEYILLGSNDVDHMIDSIINTKPDVIINMINGDSNLAFFNSLYKKAPGIPTVSFSIAEDELLSLNNQQMLGHYAAWNYFQTLDTEQNKLFVANFKKRYGKNRTTNASMEAGYIGVHLWANAIKEAGTTEITTVLHILKGQEFDSPEGKVRISSINNHLWKPFYIGQIKSNNLFEIVWKQETLIRPIAYPKYQSIDSWQTCLDNLYKGWGNKWSATLANNSQKVTE